MYLKDKTYNILKTINDHNNTMHEQELSSHLTPVYSADYLLRLHLIYSDYNEDGEPTNIFHVDSEGYKYMVNHQKEIRQFWMNFLSQFITGLITGSVGTLIFEHVILRLL